MIDKTDPTNRDSVPAMLTPGEFVLNKEAVQLFGPSIQQMNEAGLQLRQQKNVGGAVNASPVETSVALRNEGGLIGFLKEHEGYKDKAYQDSGGVWTIGYGRTTNSDGSPITEGQETNQEEEDTWLNQRATDERAAVDSYAEKHGYDWSDSQKDALSSFRYNGGQGMLDQLTDDGKRDTATIQEKLPLYNKVTNRETGEKEVIEGLNNRRGAELDLFTGGGQQEPQQPSRADFVSPVPGYHDDRDLPLPPQGGEAPAGDFPSIPAPTGYLNPRFQTQGYLAPPQPGGPEFIPLDQQQRSFNSGGWISKIGNALTGGAYDPYIPREELDEQYVSGRAFAKDLDAKKKAKRKELLWGDTSNRYIKRSPNNRNPQVTPLDLPTAQYKPPEVEEDIEGLGEPLPGYKEWQESLNNKTYDLSTGKSYNQGGVIPMNEEVQYLNFGGFLKSLLQPSPQSVIGQQQQGNILPAHVRATPPGYGAEVPVPQPEFVPQAQPGQQVQGGFGAQIPQQFSGGAYESPPVPQVGTGAQHGRNTVIPSAASIPNVKGGQASLSPPPKFSDEDLLQNSSEETTKKVHPRDAAFANRVVPPPTAEGQIHPRDLAIQGREQPEFVPGQLHPRDIAAASRGLAPQVGTGGQHGRDDIDLSGLEGSGRGVGPQWEAPPLPGQVGTGAQHGRDDLQVPQELPSIYQGYENYTQEQALADAQGVEPETDNVDWNSLQGLGIPHAGEEANAVTDQVQGMVVKEQQNISDQIISSAQAQSTSLNEKAAQAAENGDFQRANQLTAEAKELMANAETEHAAQEAKIADIKGKYDEGRQARFDAENQWRESQGLPPKPVEEQAAEEVPAGESNGAVVPDAIGPKPNSLEAKAEVADIVTQKGEQANPGMTAAKAETAGAQATPQQKSEAMNSIKESFGKLVDQDELVRMGVLFAGAMLTGASPAQALSIAGQSYMARIDAKNAGSGKHIQDLVKGNKYTGPSIQAYKESGDPSDLISKEQQGSLKQLGNQKEFYGPKGNRILATEVEDAAGNKFWLDKNQKPVNLTTNHQDASRVSGTPEYRKRIQDTSSKLSGDFKELQERFGKFKDDKGNEIFKTDLTPGKVGDNAAKWAISNDIPPADMGSLLDNAYASARADSTGGKRVKNIEAYLNDQYIQAKVGDPSLFQQANGESASGEKVTTLMNNIARNAGLQGSTIANSTTIMQKARPMWAALDDDTRKSYNRRAGPGQSGFMVFLQTELQSGVS